jgi:hypothetical protein
MIPIVVTLEGIVTDVNAVHCLNACRAIYKKISNSSSITIIMIITMFMIKSVIIVMTITMWRLAMVVPIVVTPLEIITDVNDLQDWKACGSNDC